MGFGKFGQAASNKAAAACQKHSFQSDFRRSKYYHYGVADFCYGLSLLESAGGFP